MWKVLSAGFILLLSAGVCLADQADSISNESTTSLNRWVWGVGLRGGSFKYEEPGLMEEKGTLYRLQGQLTYYMDEFCFSAELSAGFGSVDYDGGASDDQGNVTPIQIKDIRDNVYEYRFFVGRPLQSGSLQIIPAVGLGLRYLDDLGGSKPFAYDRHSSYTYLPIKVGFIKPMSSEMGNAQLRANVEYDYFLGGTQKTDLSDANFSYVSGDTLGVSYPDFSNDQKGGNGFRFSLSWVFGSAPGKISPQLTFYYESWRIDESAITLFDRTIIMRDPVSDMVETFMAVEPKNSTSEIGISVSLMGF